MRYLLILLFPTLLSAQSLTLSWTDNSSNEAGFTIERSLDGNRFAQVASVRANVVAYTDTGLAWDTQYVYRVRAWNASGNSGYTNTARGTTASPPPPDPDPRASRIRDRLKQPARARTITID